MSSFGKRLRQLRIEKNLTQEELGNVIKKSKHNISKYELDQRQADDETKKQLATFFNVSLDYLMCYSEEPLNINKTSNSLDKDINILEKKLETVDNLFFKGKPMNSQSKKLVLKAIQLVENIAETTSNN